MKTGYVVHSFSSGPGGGSCHKAKYSCLRIGQADSAGNDYYEYLREVIVTVADTFRTEIVQLNDHQRSAS